VSEALSTAKAAMTAFAANEIALPSSRLLAESIASDADIPEPVDVNSVQLFRAFQARRLAAESRQIKMPPAETAKPSPLHPISAEISPPSTAVAPYGIDMQKS